MVKRLRIPGSTLAFAVSRTARIAWIAWIAWTGLTACGPEIRDAPSAGALLPPKTYPAPRIAEAIEIDGRIGDPAWEIAAWSDPFVDIQGDVKSGPRFETRMKMAWNADYLYIAAVMEEPHVWASLTDHDQIVFHDNDFEVFIDPDGDTNEYYEIEINAFNTIFDLFLHKPYDKGGPADHDWNCAGLVTAVHVEGTLNDPSDEDVGWSVEIAIPWAAMAPHAHRPTPPEFGDTWRINFSRVEWWHFVHDGRYRKIKGMPEDNWVWTPQGPINMHVPERWGYVNFIEGPPHARDRDAGSRAVAVDGSRRR